MIIVTGASKGIGKAICERLLSLNIQVLGLARNVKDLEFNSLECDVSSYDSIDKIRKNIEENGYAITGLINVAGVASLNLAITTPAHVTEKVIRTNLLGTIFCSQIFSPFMLKKKSGVIINFSTIAVPLGIKGESVYVASKAGVEAFTKVLARELESFNINVHCIAPGPIDTKMLSGVTKTQIDNIIKQQIIQKQFSVNDICDLVELLLDKRSQSLSGEVLHVGGI